MHPNNTFTEEYPLEELITVNPNLKRYVFTNEYGNKTLPFSDKTAVKELNKALLKHYYKLEFWDIPENNLCPPIPGRLDYLLHVNDLLENKNNISLLDIGTGANLIYPILGTCHFNWNCTASEVDKDSIANTSIITAKNPTLNSVKVIHQKYKNSILDHVIQTDDFFDVVVCNPPFFKNAHDAEQKNKRKTQNLNIKNTDTLNFGGHANELWYKGGEEAFIKKMALESENYKTQVTWFTSLVSQKENLKNIKRAINKTNPTDVRVIDMEQGNKKSRFIAWRF